MDIVEAIDHMAQLYIKKSNGEDVDKELKDYKDKLSQINATYETVEDAVAYLVNSYSQMLYRNSVADRGRYETLIRTLQQERIISKKVFDSLESQFKAINDEESKGEL